MERSEDDSLFCYQTAERVHHLFPVAQIDILFTETGNNFRNGISFSRTRCPLKNNALFVFQRGGNLIVIIGLHIIVVYIVIFAKFVCCCRELQKIFFLNLSRFHFGANAIHEFLIEVIVDFIFSRYLGKSILLEI